METVEFTEELSKRIAEHKDSFITAMLCLVLKLPKSSETEMGKRIAKLVQLLKETDVDIYNGIYEFCWDRLKSFTGD